MSNNHTVWTGLCFDILNELSERLNFRCVIVFKPNRQSVMLMKFESIETSTLKQRKLVFRYEVMEPPDGLYGDKRADGNWSGLIGMLMREVRGHIYPTCTRANANLPQPQLFTKIAPWSSR